MKIIHGGAYSTGGGCISVLGELDNGYWFCSDVIGWSVFNFDVRKTCKEMGITWGNDDDLAVYWIDASEDGEYYVDVDQKELDNTFHDFCIRYDCKEPGITKGYEEFNGGVWGNLCDHIDWSHTKIDEYSKPINFKDIIKNKINYALDDIFSDISNTLDIEMYKDTSKELEKAKTTLVYEIIDVLDKNMTQ